MGELLVGIAAAPAGHGDREGDGPMDQAPGVVAVSVVSVEDSAIEWHLLTSPATCESVATHLRVLLDDLQWRRDRQAKALVEVTVALCGDEQFAETLADAARERGCSCSVVARQELPADQRELVEESLRLLLRPSAVATWNATQKATDSLGFETGVGCLYASLAENGRIIGNPRCEQAFGLSVEEYSAPVRPYLRLNEAMRSVVGGQGLSVSKLLRPFLRTKHGSRCLQRKLDRPEVDVDVIRHAHDALGELISGLEIPAFGPALVDFFDCVKQSEQSCGWFCEHNERRRSKLSSPPTLQEFRTFCRWIRQLKAACEAFAASINPTRMPVLQHSFARPICSAASTLASGFVEETISRLDQFDFTRSSPHGEEESADSVGGLRRQIAALTREIHAHRTEVAANLLLRSDRVKVVFDDDDFAPGRSTAASSQCVLFRVTRQDAHRVIQASATKDPRHDARVTLVFSRRTTGVWFSTPRLDVLAAQRRAVSLAVARLEAGLVASLAETFEREARLLVQRLVSVAADLDVVSCFAQATIHHGYVRATLTDKRQLQTIGLHWPWDSLPRLQNDSSASFLERPRPVGGARDQSPQTCVLDDDHSLVAIHSAVDDDASLLVRLGLVVLLNQIGCFVPCADATLAVLDALFLRTGAVDRTLAHESTFLTEMQHVSAVLERLTPRSLVLVDELCRGTAPDEGLPLAVEICRYLIEQRAFACVATQWTELFDALVEIGHVSVPSTVDHQEESTETKKRSYRKQLQACDRRFIANLREFEFPPELVELITQDLSPPAS